MWILMKNIMMKRLCTDLFLETVKKNMMNLLFKKHKIQEIFSSFEL